MHCQRTPTLKNVAMLSDFGVLIPSAVIQREIFDTPTGVGFKFHFYRRDTCGFPVSGHCHV